MLEDVADLEEEPKPEPKPDGRRTDVIPEGAAPEDGEEDTE